MNNIELLKRTISNLKAMYDINHEYMERSESAQLLDDIISLTKQVEALVYDEALKSTPVRIERYGATWRDEDGVRYDWEDTWECFFSIGDCKYYEIKERIDDDEVLVVAANKTFIDPVYAEVNDLTFIMESVVTDGDIKSCEVVSWFHGSPIPEIVAEWNENRSLKAIY